MGKGSHVRSCLTVRDSVPSPLLWALFSTRIVFHPVGE